MGFTNDLTKIGVFRIVTAQATLTAISGITAYLLDGRQPMFAALYGGFIVVISSWWMANRLRHATEVMVGSKETGKKGDKTSGSLILFAGLAQRLLFIGAAFAYGIGYLELPPLPMIVTFAVASAGYIFVGRR